MKFLIKFIVDIKALLSVEREQRISVGAWASNPTARKSE